MESEFYLSIYKYLDFLITWLYDAYGVRLSYLLAQRFARVRETKYNLKNIYSTIYFYLVRCRHLLLLQTSLYALKARRLFLKQFLRLATPQVSSIKIFYWKIINYFFASITLYIIYDYG